MLTLHRARSPLPTCTSQAPFNGSKISFVNSLCEEEPGKAEFLVLEHALFAEQLSKLVAAARQLPTTTHARVVKLVDTRDLKSI